MTSTFVLTYLYVPNAIEIREPWRKSHISHSDSWRKHSRLVRIVSGGQLEIVKDVKNKLEGAQFLFECETGIRDQQACKLIEQFVAADPYYSSHVVLSYTIRKWAVRVSAPVRDKEVGVTGNNLRTSKL